MQGCPEEGAPTAQGQTVTMCAIQTQFTKKTAEPPEGNRQGPTQSSSAWGADH